MTQNTNVKVNLTSELRLKQALKEADATVTHLTVSGTFTSEDFRYIRKKMNKTLRELDLGNASTEKNKIQNWELTDCTELTSITIPASITGIGRYAFSSCDDLINIAIHPDNPVYTSENGVMFNKEKNGLLFCPKGRQGDFVIPCYVNKVGDEAFCGCSGLTSITIPDSLTEIGNNAFSGCSGLTSVIIPDSVVKIGNYAFSSCAGLTSIAIPASVVEIGEKAFVGCPELTSLAAHPDNRAYTSENGILFNKERTELIFYPPKQKGDYAIPDSIIKIGVGAFSGCSGLVSVIIPDSVVKIGDDAFGCCSGLTSINIPYSVIKIGENAFFSCSGLTSVVIPNSVVEIGWWAFCGCSGLTSITIPDSVVQIGNFAFGDCTGLTSIAIPDSVVEIGLWAFCGCSGLTSIAIPDSVLQIGKTAFDGCTGLSSITIANSVIETSDESILYEAISRYNNENEERYKEYIEKSGRKNIDVADMSEEEEANLGEFLSDTCDDDDDE